MSNDVARRRGSSPASGGGGGRRSGLPPGTDPRKWSARFPVYQIDFMLVASGKRVASTKRRVRWRFGFPNRDALEAGETGTACRGEEHDVTIVWSVTSGKRLILADGQEVHYSTNRAGVLEYSWTMRGNRVLKVLAHAAPAMTATPGFRQYDLFIDGQSFFNMPKVYELGLKGPIPSHARKPGVIDHAERTPTSRAPPSSGKNYDLSQGRYVGPEVPRDRDEEQEDLQRAISASIEESRQHLAKNIVSKHNNASHAAKSTPAPAPVSDTPAPVPAPAVGSYLMGRGAQAPAPPKSVPLQAPVPPMATYDQFAAPPAPAATAAPPAAVYDPFSSPPAYGVSPPVPVAAPAAQQGALVPAAPQTAGSYYGQQAGAAPTPPATATAPYGYGSQPPAPVAAPQPVYNQFAAPPAQAGPSDPFAPQAPAMHDPFAPNPPAPPTFNDISSTIMGAYGASDVGSAAGSAPPITLSPNGTSQPESFAQPTAVDGAMGGVAPTGVAEATPQFAHSNINTTVEEENDPKDDVGKLMKSLVNIDDISSPVENLNLNSLADDKEKEEKEKEKAQKQNKSRGIPPPAAKWSGFQPSLAEMQQAKPAGSERTSFIANPNTFDPNVPHAGALVLHGSQTGGPPPCTKPTGFGVGTNFAGIGYGGQSPQQPAPYMQQQQQQHPGYGVPPAPQYQQPPPPQQGYANYQY